MPVFVRMQAPLLSQFVGMDQYEWGISDGREADNQSKLVQLSQVVHCLEELVYLICAFSEAVFPFLLLSLNSFSLCLFLSPLILSLKSRFRDWGKKKSHCKS